MAAFCCGDKGIHIAFSTQVVLYIDECIGSGIVSCFLRPGQPSLGLVEVAFNAGTFTVSATKHNHRIAIILLGGLGQ